MTMTNALSKDRTKNAGRRKLQVSIAAVSLLAGCSNGTAPTSPALPPPVPSNATAYIGTQAPGLWTMSVDTAQNLFSYQSQAAGAVAVSGGLLTRNGVLDFGNASGAALGRAVAQPAGGALLRPGGESTYPVAMVQQSGCVPVTGSLRYIYARIMNSVRQGAEQSDTGYGTFVVSASSDATTWNFTDLHNYVLTSFSSGYAAGTENGSDPGSFAATCSATDKQGAVTASANDAFPVDSTNSPSLPTFHFNPGGAFIEDRNNGISWAGFVMPQAAIKSSDVRAQTYRGFVFEGTPSAPIDTRTVAFAAPGSGTATLAGGVFPNEDLTAIPLQQYTMALGTPDASLNGVFPNAKFTAQDVNAYCSTVALSDPSVTESLDVNGNAVCTALGVAVVGQIGGKYVVYFISRDGTKQVGADGITGANSSYVIQFYLYQQ